MAKKTRFRLTLDVEVEITSNKYMSTSDIRDEIADQVYDVLLKASEANNLRTNDMQVTGLDVYTPEYS